MKKATILFAALFFLYSCGSSDSEAEALSAPEINMWNIDQDSIGNLTKAQILAPDVDTLSPDVILRYLNNNNPGIKLEYNKQSGDTLFLKIPDATFLTQQMGSSGPEVYFAEVVYNCTEIPGIKFINLDFKEGDHAEPGTFNRESFKLK